ncbi:hypothetical protein Adt_03401 [Abeliophyllum distichum]|uniref:Uncharacterized protein n=1 Tax=Abeliophyllum distichum TaxID=126358 RepID=A0ABD1W0H5_9LAMI
MQKHIWAEREVILTDFSYSEMVNLIHSCGWQRVAGKPHLAYLLLVKEFLANFNHGIEEPKADHRYTTWVRGKWIKFSPAVITNYYGLSANDNEPIPADVDMTQCATSRSPMFPCLISVLCLADGVSLLPHEELESPEPPITKRTLRNPVARRAVDNLAPIPAAKTDRLLR